MYRQEFRDTLYFSELMGVPVYAFVEDHAASGGYLIACAADKIFVSRFSLGILGCMDITKNYHSLTPSFPYNGPGLHM